MTPKTSINVKKEFKKLATNETNGSSTTAMKKKKAEDSDQNRGANTSKSQFNPKTVGKGFSFESAVEGLVQKKKQLKSFKQKPKVHILKNSTKEIQ